MDKNLYSEEEIKDIEDRIKRANETLKELQLFPSVVLQKINMGDDIFADKAICFLADSKYHKPIPSPFKTDDK